MKSFLVAYIASLLTFLVVDALWLGLVAKKFYADQLGHLMRPEFLIIPAGIFYLLYSVGIVLLAVRPEQSGLPLWNVTLYGAALGFIAYGTYNFTNMATLKDWPISMSMVDLTWGVGVSGLMALAGAIAARKFGA